MRTKQAESWLHNHFSGQKIYFELLSGDASFRRYFRVAVNRQYFVLMDAPPEKIDSNSFVAIGHNWKNQQIPVPVIYAEDLVNGFILLEDFGDNTFFLLSKTSLDRQYRDAIDVLIAIQFTSPCANYALPVYDEDFIRVELSLFKDWLLTKKLGLHLTVKEEKTLHTFFDKLVSSALEQPVVVMHRDYHSRNLMVTPDNTLGILDFQDAVMGPVTYDLVSLLRDCYLKWPAKKVKMLANYYLDQLNSGQEIRFKQETFFRWFDLMGMQRHLKAAGIFSRLSLRDGKHGYLHDIPRTLDYLVTITARYPEFADINQWLQQRLLPKLADMGHETTKL